jgi:hypothetical protein
VISKGWEGKEVLEALTPGRTGYFFIHLDMTEVIIRAPTKTKIGLKERTSSTLLPQTLPLWICTGSG